MRSSFWASQDLAMLEEKTGAKKRRKYGDDKRGDFRDFAKNYHHSHKDGVEEDGTVWEEEEGDGRPDFKGHNR